MLKIKEGNLHPVLLNIRRSDEATMTLQISIKSIFDKIRKIIHFPTPDSYSRLDSQPS
jgi:hypothetical protein